MYSSVNCSILSPSCPTFSPCSRYQYWLVQTFIFAVMNPEEGFMLPMLIHASEDFAFFDELLDLAPLLNFSSDQSPFLERTRLCPHV